MIEAIIISFVSGLLGACLTLWWARRESVRKDKLDILTILLSYRGRTDINALSCVSPAINRIQVVFSGEQEVLDEANNFIEKRIVFDFEKKSVSEKNNIQKEMDESYTKLVIAIAKCLSYKNITFDVVSKPYNPHGVDAYFSMQHENIKLNNDMMQIVKNTLQTPQ